ncbi:TerB family tellurite resistance protein [Streptomyces sp. CO7]
MLPGSGRDGGRRPARALRMVGLRTSWTEAGEGEFFCPGCGGDRNYQRLHGQVRLTVLGVPLAGRGETGPVVACSSCAARYGAEVLDHPTTARFSTMLRDAVRTVALAVLATGGAGSRTALEAAAEGVRAAGFDDCTADELALLVRVVDDEDASRSLGRPCEAAIALELHEALGPLAPHLAPLGRESILLQAARVALADGPYRPVERAALTTVGAALALPDADVSRLLESARTPS